MMAKIRLDNLHHSTQMERRYQPELQSIIDSLDQVDVASVARVAQNIFVADSMTLQAVGNVRDFSVSLEDLSL